MPEPYPYFRTTEVLNCLQNIYLRVQIETRCPDALFLANHSTNLFKQDFPVYKSAHFP